MIKTTTILLIMSALVLTNCNHAKKENKMNVATKNKVEQIPSNTLAVFETDNGKVFLTYIEPLFENSYVWQNALKPMGKPIGNGDYFLTYYITSGDYPKIYGESHSYLHIIPDGNRFKLEEFPVSDSMYALLDNGEIETGHADPISEWHFVGYSTDKNNLYAQILDYYTRNVNDFKK